MMCWTIIEGRPASVSEIGNAILSSAEKVTGGSSGAKINTSCVGSVIAQADALNIVGENKPEFIRRIMRGQGRINRTIVSAAKTLVEEIESAGAGKDADALAQIHKKLDYAAALNSKARGSEFARRLNRPQNELNSALNSALVLLADYVTDKGRRLYITADGTDGIEDAVQWHLKEAACRNDLFARNPRIIRRFRTDQYLINRCHIVAVKLMCELLSQ